MERVKVEIRLKALEKSVQPYSPESLLFETAKSLLIDWQTLLTNLTNEDAIRWINVHTNCFVCEYGGIEFGIEEWHERRVVHIGETKISSYDKEDYGSDKLLHAIWEQKKRFGEQQKQVHVLDH